MIIRNLLFPSLCIGLIACDTSARTLNNSTATESLPVMPSASDAPSAKAVRPADTASTDRRDGDSLSIKLHDGRSVALQGFKVNAKHGLSNAQCGVIIERQRVMSIGVGETDAYTCGKLVAAGIVPAQGQTQRIGLIYEVSSPNAAFRTAAVLQKVGDKWQVDSNLSGAFDDQPAGRSIAGLRRVLTK